MPAVMSREIEEWLAECPFTLWFEKQRAAKGKRKRWTIQKLASELGYTRAGVYGWTYGRALPQLKTMFDLQVITGITPEAWRRWWQRRPQTGDGTCETTSSSTDESGDD